MLSKCANPDCSARFRYFHQGKLFRIETSAAFDRRRVTLGFDDDKKKPLRRVEFYWLCEDCAKKMTVISHKETGISVRSFKYLQAVAS
jgi:hypothetical protein